ncbi:MAG: S1 family peptidase, partial [Propionibacteriaceae bacterium]|nr:S1 family peptidase [Propionibacteriaceae bacterium]
MMMGASIGVGFACPAKATEPGVTVDAIRGDWIAAKAEAAFGDRYVDTWWARDQTSIIVGVLDPSDADRALAVRWLSIAPVEVVACPVGRAELTATVMEAFENAGRGVISAGPDYKVGRVVVTALWGYEDSVAATLKALGILVVMSSDTPPESVPGRVVIVVEGGNRVYPVDTLSPAETAQTLPVMAGKEILIAQGSSSTAICTSDVVVQSGTGTYMLTAGHCGSKTAPVTLGSTSLSLGAIQASTWGSSAAGATITADVAMFGPVSSPQAMVFAKPVGASLPVARRIVDQGIPKVDKQACFSGRTTITEKCGTITQIDKPFSLQERDGTVGRTVTGMAIMDVSALGGDSGSPVYSINSDGSAVILGIISGTDNKTMSVFTPIDAALAATSSTLVVSSPFADVPTTHLFYSSIVWAHAN